MESSTRDRDRISPDDESGAVAVARQETEETRLERRDLVRWSPVIAGVFTTIATLIVLSALGVAVGVSAVDPNENAAGVSTEAAIWGIASGVLAFFLGGFVAAKAAAVGGTPEGTFNGLMVGVTAIALTVILVGFGVGNLLGAAATNLGQVAGLGLGGDGVTDAFANAEASAWATFIGLVAALALSALGGLAGHRDRAARRNRHA